MSIEEFKATLILKYIDNEGCYPDEKTLEEIEKLVSFVFGV